MPMDMRPFDISPHVDFVPIPTRNVRARKVTHCLYLLRLTVWWCQIITLGLWLRLECSLDCISGPVGYQQNIFILSLSAFLLKLKKCNYKKCNWVCGSPSILYKLVLGPVPIVHTNFQENLLMSYSWCPQLSR